MDEFGGIPVEEQDSDEFGGIAIAEPPAETQPPVTLSPYEKARLSGMEKVQGPFGPANPEEVLALGNALISPVKPLPSATGKGVLPAFYNAIGKPLVEAAETPAMALAGPALAASLPLRVAAGLGFAGMAGKSGLEKMQSPDPQAQLEGRMELAGAPLIPFLGGAERERIRIPEGLRPPELSRPQISEKVPSSADTGKAKPSEAPVSAAVEGAPIELTKTYRVLAPIRTAEERISKTSEPKFEIITPSEDKSIGINDAGERLYERQNGEVYRMRFDRKNEYPDFGGDLSPKEEPPTPQAIAEPKPPTPVEQSTSVTPPVTEPPKGIAGSVRTKWTTATEPLGSEAGFISLDPIKELVDKATPYVKGAYNFVRELGGEESKITRLNDYGKSVLNWSAKLQRSFGEAASAQKEIATKVPDPVRREGITNWIQADGDANILAQRAAATVDPKLKKGYEAALALTPEEIAVANDVRNAYQTLGQRGSLYDVLNHFKDNYVTQIWDLGKGPTFSGARTLQDKFRFDKASTFPTFFDGEQAGYTPKTKDISKLLPVYLHEMNSVISARQLVEQMSNGLASDGRPLVSPRGAGAVVSGPKGKATLITPKSIKGDTLDYRVIPNQPALTDWTWKTKDASGNPVFMKSDLALHPEAYDKLKNVLGRSAIREWYSTRTSAAAQIPKLLVKGLDMANSETKRTMLGLLAPFHQVQEGTHGVGHRVNPTFNIPKIDLVNNAAQMDAARHGLMLAPDRASSEQFMEGFRTSGLISNIPGIGPLADHYSNYLFHDYIPGLKYKTYDAILNRNQHVYAKDLASGAVSLSDVKHLSAEQANAAYGHLNYADLARNPTIQHIMQLGILAPDFFEARARFTGQAIKGLTGGKVGREQLLALATLAVAQAATAYTSAKLTGGQWDPGRPFEFHVGNRRYTMRSVPEDVSSVIHDARAFAFSRISPIIGKGVLQYLTGTDYRGQKISAGETTKELFQQPIPISIRGFVGLGRQSLSGWEQLASAVGLRISRYSPTSGAFDMARTWMKESADPKTQKRLEVQQHSVFPESEYKPLRNALNDDNMNAAKAAYSELLKTKTPTQIYRAMSHPHPFTGKATDEVKFVKSLNEEQKAIYDQAVRERKNTLNKFIQMRNQ